MKIFDMHIHTGNTEILQADLLNNMQKAGVTGGCIFSNNPKEYDEKTGTDFEERLKEVLSWTRGSSVLFPVMWIHPDEPDILTNVHRAAESGIMAFKIICNNFYVYEEKCMMLLREIAALNKPVIFHSGILWDGADSSKYNRPVFWESLIDIPNLKFSMGHCSWPWYDECIALYGKFLNGLTNDKTAEMFFDITPGTPPIYRKDLLTKLFTIGYDVPDNIMFGTDSSADRYNPDWINKWLKIDDEIFTELGVPQEICQKVYEENLRRFLGLTPKNFTHLSPVPDNSNTWTLDYVRPIMK